MEQVVMGKQQMRQRNSGFLAFFISGICVISSGIVVSLLQEMYGFEYGMTGTLLSLMSIGNLISGFVTGVLPGKIGTRKTVAILTSGYAIGYLCMGLSGLMVLLMLSFFLLGIAKGCTLNTCTILVGDNSANRTKGMNIMHSCYATGALLCPFFVAFAAKKGSLVPLFILAAAGLLMWLIFLSAPMEGKRKTKEKTTDWSFLKSKKFWLLTGLLFCQNAAEFSVNGWMVTYFKDSGIISGMLSTYTVTVMWTATLIARMLIAFVFPIKNAYSAMIKMGAGCIVFYLGMMMAGSQDSGDPAAVRLCLCHGGHESDRCSQRRQDDQRYQYRSHASSRQQRSYHYAMGHRNHFPVRRPECRNGFQHCALHWTSGVCGIGEEGQ